MDSHWVRPLAAERFNLVEEQGKPQTAGAGASKKGGQRQEDTYGERRRLPKGKFAQLTQLCSG